MMNLNIDKYKGSNYLPTLIELMNAVMEEHFTIRDTGISQRTINYWDSEKLLPNNSRIEGKWRRFNFVDYTWIKFIEELRSIGLPINIIKALKEDIFAPLDKEDFKQIVTEHPNIYENLPDDEYRPLIKEAMSTNLDSINIGLNYTPFLLILARTIVSKSYVSILVFADGSWFPWEESQYDKYEEEDLQKRITETHVSVAVSKIIREFITEDEQMKIVPSLKLLGDNEMKVLELIGTGNYESIKINFKGKKMKSLELLQNQDVRKKMVDILSENDYQDITVKSHNGMITKIQNTIKMQFD